MPEMITVEDAHYALHIVKAICMHIGPGTLVSLQERGRVAYVKKELESHLGAGNVAIEEFSLAPGAFMEAQLISTFCMLLSSLLIIYIGRIPGVSPWVSATAALAFSIISVSLFIFEFVLGAADNLSACALAVAMCRLLVQNPACIPDDTEIRFITFASEEAGMRGSRRYVQHHLGELKRLDVRLLNYETIAHPQVAILTSEASGSVKYSPEMVKSVVVAAQRAGMPYKLQLVYLGTASDAGPFSRAGLKATTLLGFNVQQMAAFYHQERDRPNVLSIEPLLNVLMLSLEWVRSGGQQAEQPPKNGGG